MFNSFFAVVNCFRQNIRLGRFEGCKHIHLYANCYQNHDYKLIGIQNGHDILSSAMKLYTFALSRIQIHYFKWLIHNSCKSATQVIVRCRDALKGIRNIHPSFKLQNTIQNGQFQINQGITSRSTFLRVTFTVVLHLLQYESLNKH